MFNTIEGDSSAEYIEKKSKFIANMTYVESVEEAENYIKEIRKKYFDARHNCFAFSVNTKDGIVDRFSDDGEPSGTAGSPMLNLLTSQGITNVVVVVTRYFGGVLLGTGGLLRAYSEATKSAIEKANIVKKDIGKEVLIEVSYQDFEKLKYYCSKNEINISNTIYKAQVEVYVDIVDEKLEELKKNINELNFKIDKLEIIKEKFVKI